MRRIAASSLILFAALMLTIAPALAGRAWCRADPVVSFNGTPIEIWVELPAEYEYLVTGPIQFDITTPSWVEHVVLSTDAGFNGYGEEIRFHTSIDSWQSSNAIVWDSSFQDGSYSWSSVGAIQFEVSVPLNAKQLKKDFGIKKTSEIPVRVRIVDPQGVEHVVEGSADSTVISVVYQGEAQDAAA